MFQQNVITNTECRTHLLLAMLCYLELIIINLNGASFCEIRLKMLQRTCWVDEEYMTIGH